MENVREKAMNCVGRAVFFGYFAISMVMLGFMFDLALFFRSGAVLTLLMSVLLLWYGQTAHMRPPHKTETWLLLDQEFRPQNDHTIRAFTQVLKEVYGYFAAIAIRIALALAFASIPASFASFRYMFNS